MHPRSIALILAFTGNAIAAAIGNDVESAKTDSKLIARDPDPNCWWRHFSCWCEDIDGNPELSDDDKCEGPAHN
ncbi:hypothetical protein HOO65_070043 [Ceratocystis lukuohia]|uniref:Uncharacterized protein n=1 Tax=Ceratocystis lukuohia TaxID=2019550 RepID=A0ABR4MBB7_9PEZI